jgi:hypothetical protein
METGIERGTTMNTRLIATVLAAAASVAAAQPDNDVLIDITGMELRCTLFGPCFPDQLRDSAANPFPAGTPQLIVPADGYAYVLDGIVSTSGLLGAAIPSGSTLAEALDAISPGGSRVLTGYSRNFGGGLPDPINQVFLQKYAGEFSGIEMGLTLAVSITDTGVGRFEIKDIDIPLGLIAGSLEVTSGTAAITTWVPSTPQLTEWHFDGDFTPATGSAAAALRYLDDPAFGTILGGINDPETPDPTTPTGVTEAQSSLTTTDALGIVGPGGENATVFVTSPARNLTTGLDKDRRGLGLALAPTIRPDYPGGFFGQWTFVWDIYIPASSWYADFPANTVPREFPVALIEDNFSNDNSADVFIRNAPGVGPTIGYNPDDFSGYLPIAIAEDTWYRLAIAGDFFTSGTSTVYINGSPVGTIEADWLYCGHDPNTPAYGDGEPVDPADWAAWGQFPNPWARSTGTFPGSTAPTGMASTVCLFSDLRGGRSEPVYIANFLFVDTVLTDADLADFGSPSADGIALTTSPCLADFNADGVLDFFDVSAFLNAWSAGDPAADFNADGLFDFFDVQAFLALFAAGCP